MKFRLSLALAALLILPPEAGRAGAQAIPGAGVSQSSDSIDQTRDHELLQRLERIARSGEPDDFLALLTPDANQAKARSFAENAFRKGTTQVTLQERERLKVTRADSSVPSLRLVVDFFAQSGDRGRIATWQFEIQPGPDGAWRIATEDTLSMVENLFRLSLNRTRQFDARNFVVRAEDLTLTLSEGSVFTIDTDDGPTGLVLLGQGVMQFAPTPETERGQARIFAGEPVVESRFDAAYVRMGSIEGHFNLHDLTPRSVDVRTLKRAEQVFREELVKSYVVDLGDLSRDTWSLLPGDDDFLSEIRTRRFGSLTYARSFGEPEDISFFERRRQRNIAVYASASKLAERGPFYDEDALAPFDILHYDLDVTLFPERLWLDGSTTMRLRIKDAPTNQLRLKLADSLVVRSIVSDRYGRLLGLRVKGQDSVLVSLPAVVLPGTELRLTVDYGGRLEPQPPDRETVQGDPPNFSQSTPEVQSTFGRTEPNFLYSNRSYWYPQAPVTDYATAVMHVTVPSPYVCVATGTPLPNSPVFVTAVGSQPGKLYMFKADRPLRYLSFVVSRFERSERLALSFPPRTLPPSSIDDRRPPAVITLVSDDSPSVSSSTPPASATPDAPPDVKSPPVYTELALQVEANPRQTNRSRAALTRAADIAKFYDSILGDIPYDSFTMALTEHTTPGGHSPGYFAVLSQTLPNSELVWRNDPAAFEGFPEFFIAHELAHQWWGQAVGWQNYHEQWLSEGFAQYFAALYAEHARGPEALSSVLKHMRKWAIDTSDQGPVHLGYRLGHIRNEGRVFRALVYNKGAIVLHMLRRLMGDDAFFSGLRRFYADWRYRKAGTDDFRVAMEQAAQRPLGRFFERWIYNASLPVMKYSWKVDNGQDGQQLSLHVEQDGEIFDLPLPLTLNYADRPPVNVVVPITERVVEVRLPLSGSLRDVDINRNDGLLAEINRQP